MKLVKEQARLKVNYSVYQRSINYLSILFSLVHEHNTPVGETGASCYRGRLLQGRFMQKYHIDGEVADSSCIRIHQRNH